MQLDYASTRCSAGRWLSRWLVLTGCLLILTLVLMFLAALRNPYYHEHRKRCTAHLRQIGQAIALYAAQHGKYPDTLGQLVVPQNLVNDDHGHVFTCPPALEESAASEGAQTDAEIAARVDSGRNLSYLYLGRGMTAQTPASEIVACDKTIAHDDGINVLYADGTVKWLKQREAEKLLARLNARISTSQPVSNAVP